MKQKLKKICICWIVGIVLLFLSWYLFKSILTDENSGSYGLFIIVASLFCIGILFMLDPFEDTKMGKILSTPFGWILFLVIQIVEYSHLIVIPYFSLMSIIGIQMGMWKLISLFIDFNNQELVVTYFITIITLLIFAYKSNQLITLFFKLFNNFELKSFDRLKIKWIQVALNVIFFRRRAYEIAIVFMIITSIEKFINAPLIDFELWSSFSNVFFEVFITFVAIDTYFQTFPKKSKESVSIR